MGARSSLNSIYLTGALAVAGLLGGLTDSWSVFAIFLIALVAVNLHSGRIRPGTRRRNR
jgi:hypothetical protein